MLVYILTRRWFLLLAFSAMTGAAIIENTRPEHDLETLGLQVDGNGIAIYPGYEAARPQAGRPPQERSSGISDPLVGAHGDRTQSQKMATPKVNDFDESLTHTFFQLDPASSEDLHFARAW